MFPSALTAWARRPNLRKRAQLRPAIVPLILASDSGRPKAAHGGRVAARRPVPQPRSNSERAAGKEDLAVQGGAFLARCPHPLAGSPSTIRAGGRLRVTR